MTSSSIEASIPANGLTEIFSFPDPQSDIVLVHGLNGHPYKTWTASNGCFWPRDLLPLHVGNERIRVLTYGYDANVTTFTDGASKDRIHHHAENLVAQLVANRSTNNATTRPLIFVCHSLGGLVTKQALIYSKSIEHTQNELLRSVYVSTFAILFLGTPHNGSDLAAYGSLLQKIAHAALPSMFMDSSPQLVKALETKNEILQTINRQFIQIAPELRIYFFYEGKPMDLKLGKRFVVEEDSAAPEMQGAERMGIARDHSTMCKFEDVKAPGFVVVADAIRRYTKEAGTKIDWNWREEDVVRRLRRERKVQDLLGSDQDIGRRPSHGLLNDGTDHIRPDASTSNSPRFRDTTTSSRTTPALRIENSSGVHLPYEIEEPQSAITPADSPKAGRTPSVPSTQPPSQNVSQTNSTLLPVTLIVRPLGFRPNSLFVGFDIELARIAAKLCNPKRSEIGACSVLLHGPPGCGKTHLAREYLYRHQTDYPNGIFWIDCKTQASLDKCFWDVGEALNCLEGMPRVSIEDLRILVATAVRKHLEKQSRWLMVFDGIMFESEKDIEDFRIYIPDAIGGNIIFTTVDKTLANRQRLLNPPGIKVYPFSTDEAKRYLYKSLRLRNPNAQQQRKATQLVKYYECLPLGIHAEAHILLATQRSLERFSPGPSNYRLAEPFLEILDIMQNKGHVEAVNLLMLVSFLHHEIPITMLHLGNAALSASQISIRSMGSRRGSSKRELDNTIATLIRFGLIERILQTSSSSSGGRSSPEDVRAQQRTSTLPSQSSQSDEKLTGDSESARSSSAPIGIDVIRVHTVVQTVFLDRLRSTTTNDFSYWLLIATSFLRNSWKMAYDRIRANSGHGLMQDFRVFENHADKIWSHFPRNRSGVSQALRQAHHDLHETRRMIKREIENQSPPQSSTSFYRVRFGSVFERSGSSSDEGPTTPGSNLTRQSTWSLDANIESVDSPTEYQGRFRDARLGDENALEDSWYDDVGYTSDIERANERHRTKSGSTLPPEERQAALRAIFGGRAPGANDPWRPAPSEPSVSVGDVEPHRSRTSSSSSLTPNRAMSSDSLAKASLAAVHRMTSPSRDSSLLSRNKSLSDRQPLSELPANVHLQESPSAVSKERHHARHPSTSPRLVQAALVNRAVSKYPDQVPTPLPDYAARNINIWQSGPRPVNRPPLSSAVSDGPGEARSLPSASNHGPSHTAILMSRDTSRESQKSTQTEPAELDATSPFVTELQMPMISSMHGSHGDITTQISGLQPRKKILSALAPVSGQVVDPSSSQASSGTATIATELADGTPIVSQQGLGISALQDRQSADDVD